MKTLYISDLDGTLLNSHDRLSDYTVETLNSLISEGMYFSFATARSLSSASVVTKGLQINLPAAVYNGAFIRDTKSGETIFHIGFSENEKEEVKEFLSHIGIYPLVYALAEGKERVSWLLGKENDGMKRYFSQRIGDKRFRGVTNTGELYTGEAFYFTYIGSKSELMPVYNAFKSRPAYRCTLQQELYREEYWCEIMPAKATKANAAAMVKKLSGCDRIISFGDAINDIPMFTLSDQCYAVRNAVAGLKKIATAVIGGNDEDGVARWLEQNFIKERKTYDDCNKRNGNCLPNERK